MSHLISDPSSLSREAHMKTVMRWILPTLLAAAAAVAHAHHGWSEYDSSKPLKVVGVIKESGYEHPHGHVRLQAADKTWLVVLAPPSRMNSRGLPASTLKPGNKAEVVGYANRNKPEEMRAERITIAGKTIELR
jgi:hypothetical protein